MSFDYEKIKQKQEAEGSVWTSYSDLFMMLSVVFLLLYVVAALRTGTNSIQKQMEMVKVNAEAQDLRKQIQAYNALKDDYLKNEANPDEAKMYEELMNKLSLLQNEANSEKRNLEEKAKENEAKARALNQYQQMVRNIINANLLSHKKIKVRNEIIGKKNDEIKELDQNLAEKTSDLKAKAMVISQNENLIKDQEREIFQKQQTLAQKQNEVALLQTQVKEKSRTIQDNQQKIQNLNSNIDQKIKELEKTSQSMQTSKSDLNRRIAIMKLENAKKVAELQGQTRSMQENIAQINQTLSGAENQLKEAQGKISEQEALKKKLLGDMALANAAYQQKMGDMKRDFDNKMQAERAALEDQLGKEKVSAAEREKRLGEFNDNLVKEKGKLDRELGRLKDAVGKAKGEADAYKNKLADAKQDHDRYLAAIDQLKKDKDNLSGDLKRAQELNEAKKKIADQLVNNLRKNGIKAGVNGKNGEVTLNFGDEYFETGKFELKENMKNILKKFVPAYAKGLFEDERVAKEISSVEIIGFSSPTYRGKYVDPQSLKEIDRTAVQYNLDLSYHRAKSIFNYIFDQNNMTYQYQKEVLPLVKVTGRSFLAEEVKGRDMVSGLSHKEYCAKFNCAKSQKVIIRFNLKD